MLRDYELHEFLFQKLLIYKRKVKFVKFIALNNSCNSYNSLKFVLNLAN